MPTDDAAALGRRLRGLRVGAFPSGTAFGQALGWSQSKVSKIENADVLISVDDLGRWLAETGASQDEQAEAEAAGSACA